MAGDWIPMRMDLADDPAVIVVAAATGLGADAVVGKLHRLWSWANRHLKDGCARGVTEVWIDSYLATAGFAAALLDAGWLRTRSVGIEFVNFDRWNSQGAKQRVLATERMRRSRDAKRDAASATKAQPEKRREEKREDPTGSAAKPPAAKSPRKEPDGMHHEFTRVFVGAWEDRYPNEKYPFAGGKDGEAVKWFREQVKDDIAKFKAIVGRFLADAAEFYRGHPIGKLRSDFAKFLVDAPRRPPGGFQTHDDRILDAMGVQ